MKTDPKIPNIINMKKNMLGMTWITNIKSDWMLQEGGM